MEVEYFKYYILSYFTREKITRISQILHVIRGKRTPSMFYITEIRAWHHGFSLNKRIERDELESLVYDLESQKLLLKKEKGYLLTPLGAKVKKKYFDKHYFPQKTNRFLNLTLYRPFWDRIQLFTQVFSEYSYQNRRYYPVIKEPLHQENVRQLFSIANNNIELVLKQWIKEQKIIFEQLEKQTANIIANFLTGHERVGKTRIQIAKQLGMQLIEFDFYFRDLLFEVLDAVKENLEMLPLTNQILQQVKEEMFFGLSQSTYQSYQMLQQGITVQQIARNRQIKENTVKEHILEIAFVIEEFPIERFIPKKVYQYLLKQFKNRSEYSFKQAVLELEELEFYHYRLVELERMRMK